MEQLVRYRSLVSDNARWEGFGFRAGDIVISTPPKCGTTWTQMICALLIFRTPDLGRPLDLISPWLDMTTRPLDDVVRDLEAQTHRRFVKTHTPFDGLPHDDRVTYIAVGRDPRDVAISMAHHMENMDFPSFLRLIDAAVGLETMTDVMPTEMPVPPTDPKDRFWLWVEDTTGLSQSITGLQATLNHLSTFWDARERDNVVMLHYGDLQDDLPGEMSRLATRLGIEIAADEVRELARAASFDAMRDRAKDVAPNATEPIWQDTTRFFRAGTSGQWRDLLDAGDLARYEARVLELVPPELAEWLHRGPVTSSASPAGPRSRASSPS